MDKDNELEAFYKVEYKEESDTTRECIYLPDNPLDLPTEEMKEKCYVFEVSNTGKAYIKAFSSADQQSTNQRYKCPSCEVVYRNWIDMEFHLKYCRLKFKCEYSDCGELFERDDQLNNHMRVRHRPTFTCDICKKEFLAKDHVLLHLGSHRELSGLERLSCRYENCNAAFYVKADLTRHVKTFHEGTYRCCYEGCSNIKTVTKLGLLLHMKKVHEVQEITAPPSSEGGQLPSVKKKKEGGQLPSVKKKKEGGQLPSVKKKKGENICNICGDVFQIRPDLKKHLITHEDPERKSYPCTYGNCSKFYFCNTYLNKHIRNAHEGDFKCTYEGCSDIKLSSVLRLKYHIKKYHPSLAEDEVMRRIEVEKVKLQDKKEDDEVGELNNRDKRKNICNICGDEFQTRFNLKRHLITHENAERKSYPCTYGNCSKFYYNSSHLDRHIRNVHEGNFKCTYEGCSDIKMSSVLRLKLHIKKYHPSLVEEEVKRKTKVEKVKLTDEEEEGEVGELHKRYRRRLMKCKKCVKEFINKRDLLRHAETHKDQSERQIYQCEYDMCTKVYYKDWNLYNHVKAKHKSEKLLYCPRQGCKRKLTTQAMLDYHLVCHDQSGQPFIVCVDKDIRRSRMKEFVCDLCKKLFKTKRNLCRHMETHKPLAERKTIRCTFHPDCETVCCSSETLHAHIKAIHQQKSKESHRRKTVVKEKVNKIQERSQKSSEVVSPSDGGDPLVPSTDRSLVENDINNLQEVISPVDRDVSTSPVTTLQGHDLVENDANKSSSDYSPEKTEEKQTPPPQVKSNINKRTKTNRALLQNRSNEKNNFGEVPELLDTVPRNVKLKHHLKEIEHSLAQLTLTSPKNKRKRNQNSDSETSEFSQKIKRIKPHQILNENTPALSTIELQRPKKRKKHLHRRSRTSSSLNITEKKLKKIRHMKRNKISLSTSQVVEENSNCSKIKVRSSSLICNSYKDKGERQLLNSIENSPILSSLEQQNKVFEPHIDISSQPSKDCEERERRLQGSINKSPSQMRIGPEEEKGKRRLSEDHVGSPRNLSFVLQEDKCDKQNKECVNTSVLSNNTCHSGGSTETKVIEQERNTDNHSCSDSYSSYCENEERTNIDSNLEVSAAKEEETSTEKQENCESPEQRFQIDIRTWLQIMKRIMELIIPSVKKV